MNKQKTDSLSTCKDTRRKKRERKKPKIVISPGEVHGISYIISID